MLKSAVLDNVGKPVSLAVPGPAGPVMDGNVTGVLAGRVLVFPPVIRLVPGPFDVVGWLFRLVVGGLVFLVFVGDGSFVVCGGLSS